MAFSDDARKELQARFSRLNAYMVGALSVLIVLSVVLDQKIREDAARMRDLSRLRRRSAIAMDRAPARLADLRERFYGQLDVAEELASPKVTRTAETTRPSVLLTKEERQLLDRVLSRASLTDEAERTEWEVSLQEAKGLLARHAEEVSTYKKPLAALNAYAAYASATIRNHALAVKAHDDLQDLLNQKQTVPSPFGSFEMKPRLALLFLAGAAAGSYVVFLLALFFILPRQVAPGDVSRFAPPAWVYTRRPSLRAFFEWRRTDAAYHLFCAVIVHGTWLLLTVFLMFECVRWNAFGTLLVSESLVVVVVRVALISVNAVLLAAAVAWLVIAIKVNAAGTERVSLSRRKMAAVVAVGIVGAAVTMVRWKRERKPLPKRIVGGAIAQSETLIRNGASKVLHHRSICGDHLPRRRETVEIDCWLHRGRESAILAGLAQDLDRILEEDRDDAIIQIAIQSDEPFEKAMRSATKTLQRRGTLQRIRQNRVDQALGLLHRAIDLEPLDVRLYDAAISRYGRLKQYARIAPLLDAGIQRAKEALRARPADTNKLKRVLAGFESRKSALQTYKV